MAVLDGGDVRGRPCVPRCSRAVRWHGPGRPKGRCCGRSPSAPTRTRQASTAASTSAPSSGASCSRRPAGLSRSSASCPAAAARSRSRPSDGYAVTLLQLGATSVERGSTVAEGAEVGVDRREQRTQSHCSRTSTSACAWPPTRTDTSTRSACCLRASLRLRLRRPRSRRWPHRLLPSPARLRRRSPRRWTPRPSGPSKWSHARAGYRARRRASGRRAARGMRPVACDLRRSCGQRRSCGLGGQARPTKKRSRRASSHTRARPVTTSHR